MAGQGLADQGERADVEPARLVGNAMAKPAAVAELADEVAAGLVEVVGLVVGELGLAPALELVRELAVAVVEEGPVEEGAVALPSRQAELVSAMRSRSASGRVASSDPDTSLQGEETPALSHP